MRFVRSFRVSGRWCQVDDFKVSRFLALNLLTLRWFECFKGLTKVKTLSFMFLDCSIERHRWEDVSYVYVSVMSLSSHVCSKLSSLLS